MDSNNFLKELKSQLDSDEAELKQVDILIKTMKDAGESVSDLENKQRTILAKIKKWRTALDKNIR
jgi:hypothetical protein